ncbi:hypothetical protein AB0O91_21200 [Kitasatospora sp. NPDC089797]|uniref:hypothetical protein n=1 Tax=Kitasatospora sp. NPDC089797 TaxID=3155298 RepID=UPI00344A6643
MSNTYTWWTERASAGTHNADGSIHIYPDGVGGDQLTIYRRQGMTDTEMLAIADRIVADVTRWRDAIAANAEATRTVEDEFAAARADIAHLKGQDGAA